MDPLNKPGLSVDVTPAPVSPAGDAIKEAAQTPQTRESARFYDLLDGKGQAKATKEAEQTLEILFKNNQSMITFGNDVLAPLNKLIDDAASDIPPVEIPALRDMMNDLHKDMKHLSGKYDLADPKVAKWLNDSLNGVKHGLAIFGGARSIFEELLFDAKNIYQKLDTVKAAVGPKEIQAVKNVGLLDGFISLNDQELLALVYKIAVMEQIEALAESAAKNVKADSANLVDRGKVDQKRALTEFANNMSIKTAEFKNRAFLGWAAGPQLTNKRTLNLSLAVRLNSITNVSMPSVKFAVEQWEIALQERQIANLIEITDKFDNAVLIEAAKAGAQIAGYVADVTQTPSLRPETMKAIADSIAAQCQATADAYVRGLERRKIADDAFVKQQRVISGSQSKVTDAFLNGVVASANTASEQAETEHSDILALAKASPAA